MDKKSLLEQELINMMEEETKDLVLSSISINKIINSRKKTWRDKLNDFLNKEIEIPLAPAVVGVAALFAICILPKDLLKNQDIRIINIGSSQVFIRNYKDVSRSENKD